MTDDPPRILRLKIEIPSIKRVMDVGVLRASSFYRLGLDQLDSRDGGNFELSSSVGYRFWPDEIDNAKREEVKEEYRHWLVGSCLRELESFFSLFLDRIWVGVQSGEMHGSKIDGTLEYDQKFARNTNTADKQKRVSEKTGCPDYKSELSSLSLARNALTHYAGIVRSPYDCNNDERTSLIVQWKAFEMLASRGGEERVVERAPFDTWLLPGEGEIEIGLRYIERSLSVNAGEKIEFSGENLAEICMFYKLIADENLKFLTKFLKNCGLDEE